jgi:hypothetical protein
MTWFDNVVIASEAKQSPILDNNGFSPKYKGGLAEKWTEYHT